MRILISGGGTAGHVNPALAIAGRLRSDDETNVIEYVGTKRGLETKLVPREGYKLHTVTVRGFKRSLLAPVNNIEAAVRSVTSIWEAEHIIKRFRPDVVIGTGGYVCWPVLRAAAHLGIPTAVHEQNAVAGLTVRMLSKYVDKIMISFEASRATFEQQDKVVLVGNPISAEMLSMTREEARRRLGFDDETPLILSYGGSLGAEKVNENVLSVIESFSEKQNVYHVHATGRAGWKAIRGKLLARGYDDHEDYVTKGGVTVREYIYDMPVLLAAADVVICRAGAMTLSELAAMGKAAIIIPSPNVTNDQQTKNARVFENIGGAILLEEKNLTPAVLEEKLAQLIREKEKRESLSCNIRTLAVLDSLDRIDKVVRELTAGKGKA